MAETTENLTKQSGEGATQGTPMTEQELHDFVHRYTTAFWGDVTGVLNFHAADSVIASGGEPGKDMKIGDLVPYFADRNRAFPDTHMWVYNLQYDPSRGRVTFEWEVEGTFKESFKGIPPTNQKVHQQGRTELIIRDGKIIRETSHQDMAAFMRQIAGQRASAP